MVGPGSGIGLPAELQGVRGKALEVKLRPNLLPQVSTLAKLLYQIKKNSRFQLLIVPLKTESKPQDQKLAIGL